MIGKVAAALLSGASLVAAQTAYATMGNATPNTIYFQLVDASGVIDTSSIEPGTSHEITLLQQVSMKMSFDEGLASPYQFEFNYDPSTGFTYYDFSAIDGNPFVDYARSIIPTSASCQVIRCSAGDNTNDCQYTTPDDFGAPGCPGSGNVLNAAIGQ